jgi:CHAT domain-containing protein
MSRVLHWGGWLAIAALVSGAAVVVQAASPKSLTLAESFRIGDAGVICNAQARVNDASYRSMFDRAYDVVCTDAASPVGKLYAFRADQELEASFAGAELTCGEGSESGGLRRSDCTAKSSGLAYVRYSASRNGHFYAAQGLAAYDAALRLGAQSLMADRVLHGRIDVAVTGAGDPAALARLQAEQLDPVQALSAAYDRANSGNNAEASQYFDALVARAQRDPALAGRLAEYLANLALQQSVMGNRVEADRLFARADTALRSVGGNFGVVLANFRAMHHLNAGDAKQALAELDKVTLAGGLTSDYASDRLVDGYIDRPLSQKLAVDDGAQGRFWGSEPALSDLERGQLFHAQSLFIRAAAERMQGKLDRARALLAEAAATYQAVRGGRVRSMGWLTADIVMEQAVIADIQHREAEAKAFLLQGVGIIGRLHPDSAVWLSARAQLAEYQARHGETDKAIASYRQLIREADGIAGGASALRGKLGAYLGALADRGDAVDAVADFFRASQLVVRPGVAQTQEVLARELSAGSDEAAGLFRQSVNISRRLVAMDAEIARITETDQGKAGDDAQLVALRADRAKLADTQTGLQAQLASFPRFRAVNDTALDISELQGQLRKDEAYYKLVLLDEASYGLIIQHDGARVFRIKASPAELENLSNSLRDTIVSYQGNQLVTNPFDVVIARRLYQLLFDPVAPQIKAVHHLVFEPDGPMLKVPANLLIAEQAGVDAYLARQTKPNADAFDMTGIAWMGRDKIVSTSVSPRSFVFVRSIAPSGAKYRYLGMGQNAKIKDSSYAPQSSALRDPCDWPLSLWNHPVNGAELSFAAKALGGEQNQVITGADFTDSGVRARGDLKDFRVIQFATHGLVTAPHPGCPARPALVTSFGPGESTGLLTFRDIFDLRLNADMVVLSACDTAGAATSSATREAGIATGGNFALDGLVRAFVGAGARSVLASHWPLPDDFGATRRLMGGFYQAAIDQNVGDAMRQSQIKLMDDPLTSHPYYWAAFAIVGDATKPITTREAPQKELAAR